MLIKLKTMILVGLILQAAASLGAGAGRKKPALTIQIETVYDPENVFYRIRLFSKAYDPYVVKKFKKQYREKIEYELYRLESEGFKFEEAYSQAKKNVFVEYFPKIRSGSAEEWSRYLKAKPHSINPERIPSSFNLLHHDPALVVSSKE